MAAHDSDLGGAVHVLLLPYPSQGHINPILQFGKRLASHAGVRCTLAVTRYLLGQGRDPCPGAVHLAEISDGFDRGGFAEADGDVAAYLARLESVGSRTVDELLRSEAEKGRPVRAVVYDAFLQPWAPRVARQHGAACASLFTQAPAVNVAYAHAGAGRLTVPVLAGTVPPELPGLPAGLGPDDVPSFLAKLDECPAYLDLLVSQFVGLDAADHVLVNSFHELQPLESAYMASMWGAKTVGPTVPSAYLDNRLPDDASYGFHLHTPTTAATKAWLDARPARSVAYVSFGSIAALGPEQMAEVAEGLFNSGAPFLWVVRALETSKIPDGFADKVGENGLIVPWTAQLEVLAHGAVGCFVTHCGWNSTTEALSAGVPMVAVPHWSDQPTNAKYIEDVWRVGVRARPDAGGVVRREEVERCVREVMGSEQYRTRAAEWSGKTKAAMSEGGSSDRNILEFLRGLRSRKSERSGAAEDL
ncbi:UDP-glucosyltransferase UGT13248 [Aegilops tauschii subsp. strangulata]|uniref:Glycosyltransferase n=3 Tax=Aegilops tauschii subsp. strangulata TaxID=200361 RepID=A0A453LCC4_AEGTS|nr:UDP-glucosyltransferase UGT13248 [Aegilops tauschii subsp. strangulata]